jgi:flavin-dependent dehydrogenase
VNRTAYTIMVLGGGPAGAVAARVLAREGIDVLLVDARPPDTFRVGESLVPAARTILTELGLWERFIGNGHAPCYGNVAAWGSPELVEMDFIRSPYGHGWHLDRAHFDRMLQDMAVAAGAALCQPARPAWFRRCGSAWRIALQSPQGSREVKAVWLLDCTGRSYRLARALGLARHYADRLLAFYARFQPDPHAMVDQDSRTLVESAPQGWFHSALLPSGERLVTCFTDAGTPWAQEAASQQGFLGLIQRTMHLSRKLATHGFTTNAKPRPTDARSSRLERFHGEDWLAAGDAAIALDPLSSQGILSALYSGLKAAKAIMGCLVGDREALPQYNVSIMQVYAQFLRDRLHYYGAERRWPESLFWKTRRAT